MTTTEQHVHKWRRTMHIDGCHSHTSAYTCACGATAQTTTERNVAADPYSAIWMEPGVDEEGNPQECARCKEIQAGAKISHHVGIVAKDGTVEKDEVTWREQAEDSE